MVAATTMDSIDFKVSELLKEVQLDYTPALTKLVDDAAAGIKQAIDTVPENLNVTEDLAPGFVRDIGADKVQFNFRKPEALAICGSYAIKCVTKPGISIDLLIRLPKECFVEKDYLNHRYHGKRFLYLCVIKKYLKQSPLFEKVEWSSFQNEARKPVLIAHPVTKLAEAPGLFIRIIPAATSIFNISKLTMKRNNIQALKKDGNSEQATHKYNSSILEDMFLEQKEEAIKKAFSGWKELGEALVLLKVWARQRSTIYAYDCLNGFLISMLVAYLASESGGKYIKQPMNTMQIFRAVLDFIANSKRWELGLHFKPHDQQSLPKEDKKQYLQLFPVVLSDPYYLFNVAFRITNTGFKELQGEAASTLSCMLNCRDGGFEMIFLSKIDYPAKYDYCLRLNLKGKNEIYAPGFCLDDECWRVYEEKVLSLLHRALGDRVKFIRLQWRNVTEGRDIENGLHIFDSEPLLVGISANQVEEAFRLVDIGPNADNKEEAIMFRKFWGEKAELRRFKDGRIAESVVWESEPWERHLIIKKIAQYILSRHLSLSEEYVVHIVGQLDFSLCSGVGGKDPISSMRSLLEAFDTLSRCLLSLDNIPLKVSSVLPIDPALRSTSVYPPQPHSLATKGGIRLRSQRLISTCIRPLDVLIQLEGSGNWPLDEVAIEKTKCAFLVKIGESLHVKLGMTCIASEENIDVLISGYGFRLNILHERGLSLLSREVTTSKKVSSADRKLFHQSQHASMINGFRGQYPIYGPIVRLAKRWVASHLFSACLVEEAIELLVAYLFLKPLPFSVPCSRITGFLRFLRLLSEYDWTFSPLVVDINIDLSSEDEKKITENFKATRKSSDEDTKNVIPAMYLATAYDKTSEAWTGSSPNSSELKRLMAYARSSADLLTKLVLNAQMGSYQWECLFRTPLNNYDAVVLLHRDKLPYPQYLLFPSEMSLGKLVACGNPSKSFHPFLMPEDFKGSVEDLKSKLLVDFDPVKCFLVDLEKKYPDTIKTWYDSIGGDAVGLTWGKPLSKKRERDDTGEEAEDPIDMMKSIGKVGKGLVRSVYLLKAPRR
uniref:Nucleolar protein 6 n=1 Tax=Kalanchoe fedtschenkoi TaxID=63787 RepID=A0A7N0T892_KALFE